MKGTNLKKWGARTIVAVAGLLTSWATTGTWDTEETVMAITVVSAALTSLLVNPDEQGGV